MPQSTTERRPTEPYKVTNHPKDFQQARVDGPNYRSHWMNEEAAHTMCIGMNHAHQAAETRVIELEEELRRMRAAIKITIADVAFTELSGLARGVLFDSVLPTPPQEAPNP